MVGPRRPIVVVAGEACTPADTVVGDSVVADQVVADSMVAVVGANVQSDRIAKGDEV